MKTDKKTGEILKIRDAVITEALLDIEFEGWSDETIARAAEREGGSPAMVKAVFPNGLKDVLKGFADLADREMLAALEGVDPENLRIRDRVRTALMARYAWLNQYKEAERQALQYWAFPMRKPSAAKIVWRTADRIWDWTGDTATDYNRYTKRGLLSGVIVSTTLAWLNDPSEDMDNTKAFLDRRIENVMQLGKVLSKVKPQVKAS